MKNRTSLYNLTIIILATLAFAINVKAQDIPKPEFTRKPYILEGGTLKDFEAVTPTVDGKVKGLGYGGYESFYVAPGISSPVKFSTAAGSKIVVLMDDNTDPSELFVLMKVSEVKKESRRFLALKTGFNSSSKMKDSKITLSAKKIQERYYELVPQTLILLPGEYAIMGTGIAASPTSKLFCFGAN
ncbi:MAG TPA: hypothetical protein VGQ59_15880 [Cyclobacteriaceae bacterium]|jgi:hypothetical protein|nr:hypothetical protein [Cyclobacteriaceae bacterium]